MAQNTEAKAPNYTAEQEARMTAAYTDNPSQETVDQLATEFQKTSRSVVAKLSRLGIYRKKEAYTRKDGGGVRKKDSFAETIGNILRMTAADVDSLTKANRSALVKIFDALAQSKPIE